MKYDLGISQGKHPEDYAGNPRMNRYGVFSGVERPKRIDEKRTLDADGNLLLLGYDPPSSAPTAAALGNIGELDTDAWYAYRYIGLSSLYQRPVAVDDDTQAFTRSNPSPISDPVELGAVDRSTSVHMGYIPRLDITHLGLYRSVGSDTSYTALAGPFALTAVVENTSVPQGVIAHIDVTHDDDLGEVVETDNFPPPTASVAAEAEGYLWCGGGYLFGNGLACSIVSGMWSVELDTAGEVFYDGIRGWTFTLSDDDSGGVDGLGNYFAWVVWDEDAQKYILQLRDENNDPFPYDGENAGTGKQFICYRDSRVLRWSKWQEPEAWPLGNAVLTGTGITAIRQVPNQPMLCVVTDNPEIRIFDLTAIGYSTFKTSALISNEFTCYQKSLTPVEGRLRGLDTWRGCIWETDGSSVIDITRGTLRNIWRYLTTDTDLHYLWHSVYDARQKIFGAFVTLSGAFRKVDYGIIQNVRTGSWFFNWEKDLLCSCEVYDPATGQWMAFGGIEGLGSTGGTWGRIWTPNLYSDWIYPDSLISGDVVSSTATIITVDNTDDDLQTAGDGLKGRWVLLTDADGKQEQLALISSNTANTITINEVYGGNSPTTLNPIPDGNWNFYLGMIEIKWGPKRFTFNDPSVEKNVPETYFRIKGTDADLPPFIRLYKGTADDYTKQVSLEQTRYHPSGDTSEAWRNKVSEGMIEGSLKWGLALFERSYEGIEIEDLTIVFRSLDLIRERKR